MHQISQPGGRFRVATLVVTLVASLFAGPQAAAAVIEITPDAMGNWTFSNFDAATSTSSPSPTTSGTFQEFVIGPETPPIGTGSVRQKIGTNGDDGARLQTTDFNGTPLSALNELSYSTYVTNNTDGQASYLQLWVDTNGDGAWDDILFFEPVYQTGTYSGDKVPDQCPGIPNCVATGMWQTWDADAGGFWSLNANTFGPPLVTLANYAAAHPGATLATDVPALRLVAGFGGEAWANFDGNVDNLTVNGDTFDFDPAVPVPTAHIQDGGDGVLTSSEVGAVTVTGTYDTGASITAIHVSIHPDGSCTGPPAATLAATLNPDGTFTAGPFNLSNSGVFPDGTTVCAQAIATDSTGDTSRPGLSDNRPVIDIAGPPPGPTPSPTATPVASPPSIPGEGLISGDVTAPSSSFGFLCGFLSFFACAPASLDGVVVTATGPETGSDTSAAADTPDYSIGGLTPGTYTVTAVRTVQGSGLFGGGGTTTVDCTSEGLESRVVTVSAGGTTDVDWTCPSGGGFGFFGGFFPGLFGGLNFGGSFPGLFGGLNFGGLFGLGGLFSLLG